jgi:flagellar basal-body rod protein FlgB
MAGLGLGDGVTDIAAYALHGLNRRAEVRANNIANSSTPGFLASKVDFESSLRAKIAGNGDFDQRTVLETTTSDYVDENGNNVNLEAETTALVSDNLLFQALVNGYNYKVGVLRRAIGGQ